MHSSKKSAQMAASSAMLSWQSWSSSLYTKMLANPMSGPRKTCSHRGVIPSLDSKKARHSCMNCAQTAASSVMLSLQLSSESW